MVVACRSEGESGHGVSESAWTILNLNLRNPAYLSTMEDARVQKVREYVDK